MPTTITDAFQSRRDPGMALRPPSREEGMRPAVVFQSRRDPGMALRPCLPFGILRLSVGEIRAG